MEGKGIRGEWNAFDIAIYTSASIFLCGLNLILLEQIFEIRSQYLFKGPYKCSNKIPSGAATLPLFSSAGEFIPW